MVMDKFDWIYILHIKYFNYVRVWFKILEVIAELIMIQPLLE